MLNVETIRKVHQAHFRDGKRIREIARDFNLSRKTVRNIIRTGITDQKYVLPESMGAVWTILETRADGDRQFVSILSVVSRYGLEPVAAACAQVTAGKTVSSDVVLTILSRSLTSHHPNHCRYLHSYRFWNWTRW